MANKLNKWLPFILVVLVFFIFIIAMEIMKPITPLTDGASFSPMDEQAWVLDSLVPQEELDTLQELVLPTGLQRTRMDLRARDINEEYEVSCMAGLGEDTLLNNETENSHFKEKERETSYLVDLGEDALLDNDTEKDHSLVDKSIIATLVITLAALGLVLTWKSIRKIKRSLENENEQLKQSIDEIRLSIDRIELNMPDDFRKTSPAGVDELRKRYRHAPKADSFAFYKWAASETLDLYREGKLPLEALKEIADNLQHGYIRNLSDYYVYLDYAKNTARKKSKLEQAADIISDFVARTREIEDTSPEGALNDAPKPHDDTPSLQKDLPLLKPQEDFPPSDSGNDLPSLGSQEDHPLLESQEDFPPSDSEDDHPSSGPIETAWIKEYYLIKENLKKNIVSCGYISLRVFNIFKVKNIQTFADLVQYTRGEVASFHNFGGVSMKEVERLLEKQGLHFGMNPRQYGVTPKKKEL